MSKSFKDLQKSMVAFNRGSGPAIREATRDAFFGGRDDVPVERLARRAFQEQRLTDFKNKFTKQVPGTGGTLLQMTQDAPRSLREETERLAKMYGPTPSEVVGDFAKATGDTLGAVGERALSGGVGLDLLRSLNRKITGKDEPRGVAPEDIDGILQSNNIQASINPLFNRQVFDPIRVSEMDPSTLMADNTVLDGILQNVNKIRNFGTDMGLDRFKFDPLNPNRGIDFEDTFMFNQTPVDYNIGIDPSGNLRFGLGFDY